MSIHLHLPLQQLRDFGEPRLRLGLVNNMPEAAFAATERQFLSLIEKVSAVTPVSVSLFALPGMLPAGQQRRYQTLSRLMESDLDGLVVTGREPLTSDLQAEPYWENFCLLLAWARKHTVSTLWSCLAAHAAVLHLDGIVRQRRKEKYFGVFACTQTAPHALTATIETNLWVPHSRWNGLRQEELVTKGYKVLRCTEQGEVDLFTKQTESLFVFAQGHPEYDSDTLLREYRRDLGRYARNESAVFPKVPASYFDAVSEARLAEIQERVEGNGLESALSATFAILDKATIQTTWAASAECLYRNWLALLGARVRVHV